MKRIPLGKKVLLNYRSESMNMAVIVICTLEIAPVEGYLVADIKDDSKVVFKSEMVKTVRLSPEGVTVIDIG